MKRIKNLSIYLFVAISIVLSSCNSDQLEISNTSISSKNAIEIYKIPFAEQQTLTDIASNKSNISYQTARKMAIIEMELSLKAQMKWSGAKLSEKPVVVYDAKSNAKYYEFIVISDAGQNIGTVTTCVQKETDAVISHVLPYVRDYSCFTTKGSSYKMISTGYPSRILIGVLAKSGDEPSVVIDPATNNSVSNLLTEDASGAIESINKLTEDQKKGFGITNADSLVNAIKEKDALNKMYAQAYWSILDTLSAELNLLSDEEVISAINSGKSDFWTSYDEYIIPAFNNTSLKNTRWNGWCGPSAIAWIYRGLYSSYNGTYLPLAGETGFYNSAGRYTSGTKGRYKFSDKGDDDNDGRQNDLDKQWVDSISNIIDGGLYGRIASIGGLYVWPWLTGDTNGPTLPFTLGLGLSTVTNAKYFVYPAFNFLSLDAPGHQHIRNVKLPVICLVNNFAHYVVAFGSKYENWNWDVFVKILGKKVTISKGSIRTNKWLYVTDNGYTTSGSSYEPFWRNDNFFSLDLQYGVYKLY